MRFSLRTGIGAWALLASMAASDPGLSETFRWVDDSGVTHYSDQVPPEATGRRRSVLSPQGREVDVIEAPKTLEQLRREQQLKQLRTEQEKLLAEQRSRDLALLRTYRSVEEMYAALRAKLETLDGIVRITEANRVRQRELLAEQERAAASLERTGQAVSQKQREVIDATRRQIANYEEKIKAIQAEKISISDRFEKDIARFKRLQELRNANRGDFRSSSFAVTADRNARDEVSAVACAVGPVCDKAWGLAREYVLKTSRGPLLVDTDRILQTSHPANDNEFGLTVTRLPGRSEQVLFLDVRCRPSSVGEALCSGPRVREVRGNFTAYIEMGLASVERPDSP